MMGDVWRNVSSRGVKYGNKYWGREKFKRMRKDITENIFYRIYMVQEEHSEPEKIKAPLNNTLMTR